MKRFFFLAIFISFSLFAKSQITITQNDFPKAGDSWTVYGYNGQDPLTATPASATSQVWDYNKSHTQNPIYSNVFMSTKGFPYLNKFPGANLIDTTDGLGTITYYTSSPSGFYEDGFYEPFVSYGDSIHIYTPSSQLMIPAPFTYGNSVSNSYKEILYLVGSNYYTKSVFYTTDNFTADAFGTITTPFYSNLQVLRIKDHEIIRDSFYIADNINGPFTGSLTTDSGNIYTFVKNGTGAMVLSINNELSQLIDESAFYSFNNGTGVSEIQKSQLFTNLYPNPTNHASFRINITGEGAALLKIYDITGKSILTDNITGVSTLTLKSDYMQSGLYFYTITDKNGNRLGGEKFIVQ